MGIKDQIISLNNSGLQKDNITLYNVIKNIILEINSIEVTPRFESGAWTPKDGSAAALTLTPFMGSYIKDLESNLVIATCNVGYPVTASGAAAAIAGLPYICEHTNYSQWPVVIGYQSAGLAMHGFVLLATFSMVFYTNAGVAVTNAQMSNNTFLLTAIYRTGS